MDAIPNRAISGPEETRAGGSAWRLAAFGVSALAAVYAGFIAIDVGPAEALIKRVGYHVMLATFVWWLVAVWRLRRESVSPSPAKSGWPWWERMGLTVLLAVGTGLVVGSGHLGAKVLYDDFVLQSTAYNLHHFREVATMVRGYDFLGTFVSTANYLDKRPYFYPFLVSLVHDVSGYRVLNAYLLNVVLLPVALGLAYAMARRWHGWRGGMVAASLLGTLPLLGQNALGSGMEMINVVMLLTAVALGARWWERGDGGSLDAFVLSVVLLAQCRYESALFVLPGALIVLGGWIRAGRPVLSAAAILAPLLLVPVALHSRVLSASPVLWELRENQVSRFGFEYVGDNLSGVFEFLFDLNGRMANSLVFSVLGVAGVLYALTRVLRGPTAWKSFDAQTWVWLAFALGIGINLVLVLFYFWSRFTDPMAARFSLPLHLLMAFAGVALLRSLDRRFPASLLFLTTIGVGLLAFTVPKQAYHFYSRLGADELEWEKRYVDALPPKSRLVISNKTTLVWLLDRIPSIHLDRARYHVEDRLAYQLTQPTFQEILVTQRLVPTSAEGDHRISPDDALPARFRLEPLAEKRFGTKISRISRLVAITPRAVAPTSDDEPR